MLMNVYSEGSQDRLEMRRRRRSELRRAGIFEGYQMTQSPEVTGGMVAAEESNTGANGVNWSAVTTGLATGVSVWLVTKLLDRIFGITGGK